MLKVKQPIDWLT